jgi:amino acid transporter
MFIIFGNISGNAIAFGMYVMIAAGKSPYDEASGYHKGAIYGLAVGVLTLCAFVHIFSRRGGLFLSNVFGLYKVLLLLVLIIFGWVYAGSKLLQSNTLAVQPPPKVTNFQNTFSGSTHDFASVVNSILAALFSYTGFEQPFYIISEVKNPRRVFPKTILAAVFTSIVLYTLTNISYMLVVPVDEAYSSDTVLDIAGKMLEILFGDSGTDDPNIFSTARRTAAVLIALSILGNILVITFTAARVKQEIAKEGILPFSLTFASGYTTPWAKMMQTRRPTQGTEGIRISNVDVDDPLEQSPIPALILHWFTSVFLVGICAWTSMPSTAYTILISLYSYTDICVVGFLVSSGLLYLKIDSWVNKTKGRNWAKKAQWTPYLDPLPNIIFCLSTTFLVAAAFVPVRSKDSPFFPKTLGYPTWVASIVGLTSLFWGIIWWSLLRFHERNRKHRLIVKRTPYLVQDDDQNYIQKVDLVTHDWEPDRPVPTFAS